MSSLGEQDREMLCEVLALQGCRHPDIFMSGHRKATRLAGLIADAPLYDSEADFVTAAAVLGVSGIDAAKMYRSLHVAEPELLEEESVKAASLSPQDHKLPMTDALKLIYQVAAALRRLSYEVIEAPAGSYFVLGDTPLPQSDLGQGFYVPVSKVVAIRALPSPTPTIGRRLATQAEVDAANQMQWNMAAKIVIGPDQAQLVSLGPR